MDVNLNKFGKAYRQINEGFDYVTITHTFKDLMDPNDFNDLYIESVEKFGVEIINPIYKTKNSEEMNSGAKLGGPHEKVLKFLKADKFGKENAKLIDKLTK